MDYWKRLCVLFIALGLSRAVSAQPNLWEADPSYSAMLQSTGAPDQETWLGADGAYSCPLSRGRTLWLFSDTLVGKPGVPGSIHMPHNTLALQENDRMRFFPKQIFTPPHSEKSWYWVYQPVADEDGQGAWVFLGEFTEGPAKQGFNFRFVRSWLAHLSLKNDQPEVSEYLPLPQRKLSPAVNFGAALLALDDQAYVYGTADYGGYEKRLLIARAPGASWRDGQTWKFFAAGNRWGSSGGTPLTDISGKPLRVSNELSVFRQGGRFWLLTQAVNEILLYEAEQPWGPFRERARHTIEEGGRGVFTYNAKAHPQLTDGRGRLLVTYNRNALPVARVQQDPTLYRPQFLRLTMPAP